PDSCTLIRPLRPVVETVAAVWVISLWLVSPIFLDWNNVALDPLGEQHCIVKKTYTWAMLTTFTDILFPMFMMRRIYGEIYTRVKAREKKNLGLSCFLPTVYSVPNGGKTPPTAQLRKQRKTAVTLGILIGAFYICWTPYVLCSIVDIFIVKVKPPSL